MQCNHSSHCEGGLQAGAHGGQLQVCPYALTHLPHRACSVSSRSGRESCSRRCIDATSEQSAEAADVAMATDCMYHRPGVHWSSAQLHLHWSCCLHRYAASMPLPPLPLPPPAAQSPPSKLVGNGQPSSVNKMFLLGLGQGLLMNGSSSIAWLPQTLLHH